ncbi:monopolar spindle [Maudiozyma exigua]|uniref:Monopolar spindle protein 2 n=1 Tax=Maudiozyma exigua TaxID=34358 RepID=A0A9P6WCP6_MAUEX|nr:monopolar spindle [Kazachstania exigua]
MTTKDQLFQGIWLEIDTTRRGFIYGKDLPLLVKKLTTNGKVVIDGDNLKLLDTFANEQAFTKIYKVVIDDTLKKLIGLNSLDLIGDMNLKDKNKTKSNVLLETESKGNTRGNDDEISILKQEIEQKNQIISNKDNELISLHENVNFYKEKYENLVDEFEYFKKIISANKNSSNDPIKNDDNDRKFDVRNQFFIEEFRRQINEQSKIINKLKEQIQSNPEIIIHEKKMQHDRDSILGGKVPIFISKKFTWFLFIISIFGLISSMYLKFIIKNELVMSNIESNTDRSSSWFYNNPIANGIYWLVQEDEYNTNNFNKLDSTEEMDNRDIDAYNKFVILSRLHRA